MRLHEQDTMSAWAMAVLIAAGYLTDWPHEWTKRGRAQVRRYTADGTKRFYGGYHDGGGVTGEALAFLSRFGERRPNDDVRRTWASGSHRA